MDETEDLYFDNKLLSIYVQEIVAGISKIFNFKL